MPAKLEHFPGTFPGTIKVPLDIPALTAAADLVGQGEVVYIYDEAEVQYLVGGEPAAFKRRVALFHIDRIYKGAISKPVIEIEFLQAEAPASMETLNQGEYLLIFLRQKNSRYQFSHLTTSKMPLSPEPAPAVRGKASALVRIRKALIRSLGDTDPEVVLTAIEQLGQLKSQETVAALGPVAAAQDALRRGAAIAALINLGELGQVEAAVQFLQTAPPDPQLDRVKGRLYEAVANLDDPALLNSLNPLWRSQAAAARYAAVRAMRNMQSEAAVPVLMGLLNDADLEVRYQAFMALAEVTGQPERGAPIDVFRQNEADYINQWQTWWTKEQQQ